MSTVSPHAHIQARLQAIYHPFTPLLGKRCLPCPLTPISRPACRPYITLLRPFEVIDVPVPPHAPIQAHLQALSHRVIPLPGQWRACATVPPHDAARPRLQRLLRARVVLVRPLVVHHAAQGAFGPPGWTERAISRRPNPSSSCRSPCRPRCVWPAWMD